jgi:CRP/FNR family transcriptional regulator, cyclic AMP receptor protein
MLIQQSGPGLMAELGKFQEHEAGQVILRENTPGDSAYIILSGGVEITKRIEGQRVVLVRLGPGGIFGEMSLIDGSPRSATVTATEPTRLSVIDNRRFKVILNSIPQEVRPLFSALTERLRNTNQMVSSLSLWERLLYSICSIIRMSAGIMGSKRERGYTFLYRDLLQEASRVLALYHVRIEKAIQALASTDLAGIESGEKPELDLFCVADTDQFSGFVDFLSERLSNIPGFPVPSRKYCNLSEKAREILFFLKNKCGKLPRDDTGHSHYAFDKYIKESVEHLKFGVKDAILRLQELSAAGAVRLEKFSPLVENKAIVYNSEDITRAQLILLQAEDFEKIYNNLINKQ